MRVNNIKLTWITSDSHLGHENIIKFTDRPFCSADEMDAALIASWNSVVGKYDIVFHLGDFTLGGVNIARKYFRQLKGDIRVLNNFWHHDKRWLTGDAYH